MSDIDDNKICDPGFENCQEYRRTLRELATELAAAHDEARAIIEHVGQLERERDEARTHLATSTEQNAAHVRDMTDRHEKRISKYSEAAATARRERDEAMKAVELFFGLQRRGRQFP